MAFEVPTARAIAIAAIRRFAEEQIPFYSAYRTLQSWGISFDVVKMQDMYREAAGRRKYETWIRNLAGNQVVPREWMNEVEMEAPYKYKVWSDVTYYDVETGEYYTVKRQTYFDSLRKKEDYESELTSLYAQEEYREGNEFVSVKMFGVDINKKML
jgi:hypothetical protein